MTIEEVKNLKLTEKEQKELQKDLKRISKRVIQECDKLFRIISSEKYFKTHPEKTLAEVIEELNPSEDDEDNQKKLVSRWIATEFQESCIQEPKSEQEKNFFIMCCQYLIYKNFDEHFSFLGE